MSLTTDERHRLERGVILQLLVEDDSEWTAFRSLWRMMDARNYAVSDENLTFHLGKYLQPSDYVALRRARDGEHAPPGVSPNDILFVKIAPKGLQIVNRSQKDPEIVL